MHDSGAQLRHSLKHGLQPPAGVQECEPTGIQEKAEANQNYFSSMAKFLKVKGDKSGEPILYKPPCTPKSHPMSLSPLLSHQNLGFGRVWGGSSRPRRTQPLTPPRPPNPSLKPPNPQGSPPVLPSRTFFINIGICGWSILGEFWEDWGRIEGPGWILDGVAWILVGPS